MGRGSGASQHLEYSNTNGTRYSGALLGPQECCSQSTGHLLTPAYPLKKNLLLWYIPLFG